MTDQHCNAEQLVSEFLRAMDRTPVIGAMIAQGGCNKALARSSFETAANRLRIALGKVDGGDIEDGDLPILNKLVARIHENLDLAEVIATTKRNPEGAFDESVFFDNLQGLDRDQLQLVGRITCGDTIDLYPKQIADGFAPFIGICAGFAAEEARDMKRSAVLFLTYLVRNGLLTLADARSAADELKKADDTMEQPGGEKPAAKPKFACTSKSQMKLLVGETVRLNVREDEEVRITVLSADPAVAGKATRVNIGDGLKDVEMSVGATATFGPGSFLAIIAGGPEKGSATIEICRRPPS